MIRYEFAPDIQAVTEELVKFLFPFININRVKCYRSYGSRARGTIARCHSIGKLMQKALGVQAFYPLEFISEQFDKLDEEEQIKIIIHELMHIPKSFGGGFRHHDFVCDKNINKCFKLYKMKKKSNYSFNSYGESGKDVKNDSATDDKNKKIHKWF